MKKLFISTTLVLLIFIFWFATGWIKFFDPYLKNLKEFSGVITAIVAMLNIFALISFRTIDSEKKKKESETQKLAFWYREIVLDRNFDKLDLIDEFVNYLKSLRTKERNEDELINFTNKLGETKREIIDSLHDSIRIVNQDYATSMDVILFNFEDKLTEAPEELFNCSTDDLEYPLAIIISESVNVKNQLTKKLFDFEVSGYEYIALKSKDNTIRELWRKMKLWRIWSISDWPFSKDDNNKSATL